MTVDAEQFVELLGRERATAIVRTSDPDQARQAMSAAVRGGFRIVEFTWTIPDVTQLIAEFSQQPELTVGAGTVLAVEQVRQAVEAGASFLVSPVVDLEVIHVACQLGVPIVPGCSTPTELMMAYRAGAAVQKVSFVTCPATD